MSEQHKIWFYKAREMIRKEKKKHKPPPPPDKTQRQQQIAKSDSEKKSDCFVLNKSELFSAAPDGVLALDQTGARL